MTLPDRFRGWLASLRRRDPERAGAPESPPPSDVPAVVDQTAERLQQLAAGTPEQQLAAFRMLRGTTREREAIDVVLGLSARSTIAEPLVLAAAVALTERGEGERAVQLCSALTSCEAETLCADLVADRGDLTQALVHIERVLAMDFEWPGARERQRRWSTALAGARPLVPADGPTLLVSDGLQTTLRLVREAGRGGAATVYEAVDEALGRTVALKIYHRPTADREQLLREAELAVRFAGPGVVTVYDLDPDHGWIALEWIAAGSLKHWLYRGDLHVLYPIERWFVPLAEAVARVHAQGFVHADLKPANVLFRTPASPLIADFGLAQPERTLAAGGSFGYLSPERRAGAPLSRSDDVYALGRILGEAAVALRRDHDVATDLSRWQSAADRFTLDAGSRPVDAAALLRTL